MSRIKELKESYRKIIKDNGGVGYFVKQKALSFSNPEKFDSNVGISVFQGEQDAASFIRTATEWYPETIDGDAHPNYPAYAEAVKVYNEKFNSNQDKVREHFIGIQLKQRAKQRKEDIEFAHTEGKKQAETFLKSVLECEANSVARFKTIFNCNPLAVEPYFVDRLYKKAGLTRAVEKNEAYEASLITDYAPANIYQQAAYDNLVDLLKLKHAAVGYVADADVLKTFFEENLTITRK